VLLSPALAKTKMERRNINHQRPQLSSERYQFCLKLGLLILCARLVAATPTSKVVFKNGKLRVVRITLPPGANQALHPEHAIIIAVPIRGHTVVSLNSRSTRPTIVGECEVCSVGNGGAISNPTGEPTEIVIVDAEPQGQPLTLQERTLAAGQTLQEASSSNDQVVIALSPALLQYRRNLSSDEKWRPGPSRTVKLLTGQMLWLRSGTYHITNTLSSDTKFVSVEF
jgi:hypothetical protein